MKKKTNETRIDVRKTVEVDWDGAEGPEVPIGHGGHAPGHATHLGITYDWSEDDQRWIVTRFAVSGRRILASGQLSDKVSPTGISGYAEIRGRFNRAPEWVQKLIEELRPTSVVTISEVKA